MDDERGLTAAEVTARVANGRTNELSDARTRTIGAIIRANVLTRFNALLGAMFGLILATGHLRDGLFGLVLVANALIGIVQEVRAKRTLDRLTLLSAPKARVLRDGAESDIPIEQVVQDDLLLVSPGSQVVVDGVVTASQGLELDESLLSGESDAVLKAVGDTVLSGSFVAAGTGKMRATKVGELAYAAQLASEAKRFALTSSELRSSIDRILTWVTWAIVPTAALLFASQLRHHADWRAAVTGAVAGRSRWFRKAWCCSRAWRSRRPCSVCHAGTCWSRNSPRSRVWPASTCSASTRPAPSPREAHGQIDRTTRPRGRRDGTPRGVRSSRSCAEPNAARDRPAGWGPGCGSGRHGRRPVLLGPEVERRDVRGPRNLRARRSRRHPPAWIRRLKISQCGSPAKVNRILVLAESDPGSPDPDSPLPPMRPLALVALGDAVRSDAAETLAYFARQDVRVMVLSGDDPRTVGAIATSLGLPGSTNPFDARELPEEPSALTTALEQTNVFGRVTPHRKRDMVQALQAAGHTVAMTGDGVNDALALKDADIGIAMGSGSDATRAVAQLVLLDSRFATLPSVVSEGRRVLGNIERTSGLYLTKTVYAMLISLAVGVAGFVFPFLPRHLTLVGAVTIGIPSFFLALAPNARRFHPGFLRRVMRFAVPTGALAALATFLAYALANAEPGVSLAGARTTAVMVLTWVGLLVLSIVATPLKGWRLGLVGAMAGLFLLVMVLPQTRDFFSLQVPKLIVWLAGMGIAAIVWSFARLFVPASRPVGDGPDPGARRPTRL